MSEQMPTQSEPIVCRDARFRAGKKLIQRGLVHLGAIKIFSTLLNRAEEEFGPASLEYATVGYEYGYALFLDTIRSNDNSEDLTMKSTIDALGGVKSLSESETRIEEALEHMVNACVVLYECVDSHDSNDSDSKHLSTARTKESDCYHAYAWAREQLARSLIGIGYVLSYQHRHPDALKSYMNALPQRELMMEHSKQIREKSDAQNIDSLRIHRLLVEVYVLIVEEILKCSCGEDIVANDSNELLIKKEDRLQVAQSYYDKAREELQEV